MTALSTTPGLLRCVDALGVILTDATEGEGGGLAGAVSEGLRRALAEALADPSLLPPEILSTTPPTGGPAKYLLHAEPRFTMFCTLMAPHSVLPAHDHGTWGFVGVYRGVEEEVRYRAWPGASGRGAESQSLPVEVVGLIERGRLVHRPGDVMVIDPPPADVHQVLNVCDDISVTLHLLGRDPVARGFRFFAPAYVARSTGPMVYDAIPPRE